MGASGGSAVSGKVAFLFAVEAFSFEWVVHAGHIGLEPSIGSGVPVTVHPIMIRAHVHSHWCVIKMLWGI